MYSLVSSLIESIESYVRSDISIISYGEKVGIVSY